MSGGNDGRFTEFLDYSSNTKQSDENFRLPVENWNRYVIQELLGEGGMARVYKALDPQLKRNVALKFIRSDDENYKKRFLREAQAQAQIEHDHV
jgi:serine/threonine protein kinase